jgi:glutaredoxin-like YruB-family protein
VKTNRWLIILLILLFAATAWTGSIYKWVDKDGVVHYSDGAPEGEGISGDIETRPAVDGDSTPMVERKNTEAPSATTPPSQADTRRKDAVVEIYTTSWCHYCDQTKRYFRSRGITFKEYDIEKDRAAARRHRRYNPRGGVPVTVINGQPIIGYAPDAFGRALQGS